MNIYIHTFGCSANQALSEMMAGLLQKSGYEIVNNINNSDLIIVSGCWVKGTTEQRLLYYLKDVQEKYPNKKLIISGCAPEVGYRKLTDIAPDVSLVSAHHIKKIAQAVKKTLEGKRIELLGESNEIELCLPRIRKNPVIGITVISSGYNGNCTYCATKIAKGSLYSYPKTKIINEITLSLKEGCKEIWITSQDTGAFGIDKYNESRLPQLLNEISRIPGNFITRVGMMNPNNISPILSELIEAFNSKKIYKFIHIPVQSGNNEILKKMNRFYTIKEYEEIVKSFRDAFRCTVWTDIIVGYPGETDEQFKDSLNMIKRLEPDWVNISRFAKREGTPAAKLKQLDTEEMKRRTNTITNLVNNIALKRNEKWKDWIGEILITEKGKKDGQWIGRNFAYKPILINKSGNLLGKKFKVKIINATPSILVGWPIKP
ncbi:MAG: tRNA (N(6)-L-threonylcarbamoyladenosine(37)-C(2))-methylthiotransferase [Nanoarchaeota archaeon]|nr:tRNA (N(6)-L-threonylcarbamoyladenosine(37)-C(2))-methylthiotransferase [Nanoarchaeota archaeon]